MLTSKGSLDRRLFPTNVIFSKQNLQNADSIVQENGTFRIQFKESDFGMDLVDIANSTLNFELTIPISQDTSINAQIYNDCVENIFHVQQLQLQGQSLKMQTHDLTEGLSNRFLQRYGQNDKRMQGGLQKEDIDATYAQYTETNATSCVGDLSAVHFTPVEYIRDTENRKKLRLLKRQFTVAAGVFTAKDGDVASKNYCVKLGDLCPELANFKYCSPKMFAGSGLEITIKLLDSTQCTSSLYKIVATTAQLCAEKDIRISIRNVYLSVVHMQNAASLSLQKQIPFMTFNHLRRTLLAGETSVNLNFSLPGSAFLRGLVITHSPSTKSLADDGKGSSVLIPAKANWETVQAPFTTGQLNYSQYVDVDKYYCQIGQNNYPKSMPPVSASAQNLVIAGQMSEQIFGMPLGVSLERFMSLDYYLFIPVNQVVSAGVQMQFYISYLSSKAGFDLGVFCVCDKVIEMSDNMSVSIQ